MEVCMSFPSLKGLIVSYSLGERMKNPYMAFRVLNNLAPSSLTFFLSHVTCTPDFFKSVLQHTSGCVTPSCSLRRNVLLGPDLPFIPDCEQMRAGMISYFYLQHLTEVAKCKCLEIVCWVILNRNLPNMCYVPS